MKCPSPTVSLFCLAASLLAVRPASVQADVTLAPPTGANLAMELPCPHPTPGWTRLNALVWNSAETLAVFNYDTMLDNNLAGQFPGTWDYQLTTGLTGTLTVDKYVALDGNEACQHGAEISASAAITSGIAAGETLMWLQVFHESGRSGSRSWIGDPPPNIQIPVYDAEGNQVGTQSTDTLPFYNEGGAAGAFWDRPTDKIPDSDVPHSGGVSFMTMLVSWSGTYDAVNPNAVHVYGGLEWGYTYQCVPEPATSLLMAPAALLVMRRRRGK